MEEQEKQHHCYNCRHYEAVYLKKSAPLKGRTPAFALKTKA